jgi:hypothetical protein
MLWTIDLQLKGQAGCFGSIWCQRMDSAHGIRGLLGEIWKRARCDSSTLAARMQTCRGYLRQAGSLSEVVEVSISQEVRIGTEGNLKRH